MDGFPRSGANGMDERTERFLEATIERGWITREQLEECRKIHETVAEVGVDQPIEEILVRKGYLTPDRARQLNRELSVMRVGKYQVLEKLGEGGAGIVYKANQEPLERVVAIKVLSRRRVMSDKYLERFNREARVAVTLNHRNIVRGLDYGEADGYHYFVMEYVEGESLYQVLKKEGVLDERRAFEIVLQVVSALRHAAKYDLVHRDIKPENVLITPEDEVKLCDLGLAKPSLVETAQASRDGTTIGTPTYMSPEQIRGKDEADFRSDVYSLGATLYHMVTGEPPFSGESADIIVRKHLREPLTDPRERNLKLSSSAASVVTKMLAKKPEERYASLDDLADDLTSVLEGRPPTHTIQFGPRTGPPPKVHLEGEPSRRSRRDAPAASKSKALIAIVVILLLAGGAVAFVVMGKGKDDGGGGDTAAKPETPPEPTGPSQEQLAENDYRKAQDYLDTNPDAPFASKADRFEFVRRKYPDTRWALLAGDRIRELEQLRDDAKRATKARARKAYENRIEVAASLVKTGRYGEAIAELSDYPSEFADTEYPGKLTRERDRLVAEAEKKKDEVFRAVEGLIRSGSYEQAVAELEKLAGVGLPEIEEAVRKKLIDVKDAQGKEREARAAGLKIYKAELGAAFLKAAEGKYQEAENDLVRVGARRELVYFGEELNRAFKQVRAARAFADALRKGADGLQGETERFSLLGKGRSVAAGRVLGATDEGVRLARGPAEEVVPFRDIAPTDRLRIAFRELDSGKAESHVDAALYFLMHGFREETQAEIRAADVLGASTDRVEAARDLFFEYLGARAEVEVLRAEGYVSRGQLKEARELLESVVERSPWYGRARFELGVVLVEMKDHAAARPELEKARELGVTEPLLEFYTGEALLETGDPEGALAAFNRFADRVKDDPEAMERVRARINDLRERALKERIAKIADDAKGAYRKGDWEKTVELYGRLNDLLPNAEDSLYYLGKAHLEMKNVLEAYRRLEQYLRVEPSGRRASDARKLVRLLEKQYATNEASAKFQNQARTEYDSGRYDLAVSLYDRAIFEGPLNVDAYYGRYLARLRIGESSGKESDFQRALDDLDATAALNPDEDLVSEGRALVLYYLDRYDEALENAEKAMERLPDRWLSYNVAGLIYRAKGQKEKAVETLTKGIAMAPNEPTLYINRALAYEDLSRYEEAREDLKSATKWNPTPAQSQQISRILDELLEKQK